MRAWLDGHLLDDPHAPAVAVTDHGVTVGDGVFEAIKVVEGVPFALDLHLQRLHRSATGLGLAPIDEAAIRQGIKEVLAEPLPLGRLRITVTAGTAPLGSGRGHGPRTTIVVADGIAPAPDSTRAVTVAWPRNERGALAGLKTTSYAENVVALAQAHAADASEAIFPNTVGNLCEGTGTNVFYVVDGELRTPSLASGCLAGVTRGLIVEWCGVREVDEPIEVLTEASEIFLASTTRDAQAVVRLDDADLPHGPVTRDVQEVWRRRERELLGH
ncbi:aminotransferase class IV [Nocardioides sp.]|uniref:aminotransferase class IV n=1 Tax=Nocardioides sp. TaxID=35761 RepID=UPI0039E45AE0